jgi:hypothetical protein
MEEACPGDDDDDDKLKHTLQSPFTFTHGAAS